MEERTHIVTNGILGQVSHMDQWKAEIMLAIYQQNNHFYSAHQPQISTWEVHSQNLVQRLWSNEISVRKSRISQAHRETFDSAYSPPDIEKAEWSSFIDFLKGETSLYWITDKPGSGKSTLMKYLFDNPRTEAHISRWSRGVTVVLDRCTRGQKIG
ncbi:hypothetical protein B0J13DRAFT_620616 [Dactylonectria estremocensis]|uniref:Uncharacterized protein n=1 Tax=Dactylonectria estremocensis TaxID=1079267 RepID=A0A9P9F346_9HYPO|nr:hypothetical protein B0J13DRAFT_620616 [Dactylonectria estremocensis]